VPDHEPYEYLTIIGITAAGDRTKVVMRVAPLHDETWSQGYRAHRGNELGNLAAAIRRRTKVSIGTIPRSCSTGRNGTGFAPTRVI
jgi:hypothetical protein